QTCSPTGMQQSPDCTRYEAIGVEVILFDIERRIVTLQIARPVSRNSLPQDEILSPRRRPNGIRLNKTHVFDRCAECGRSEHRAKYGLSAQSLEGCAHLDSI